ncbi:ribonuclease P protein subunit p29 isoform X1 [Dryobates pubescens]|uniref:ribonuclease P protein subunit p29 isoform X1 n=1 Tax=Dryobates pubescens TaxID=118200 RepID=UPI0023BA0740|nr:ribonuclease P protein subunit p29 isoform X1 [Dryobates pubescens]
MEGQLYRRLPPEETGEPRLQVRPLLPEEPWPGTTTVGAGPGGSSSRPKLPPRERCWRELCGSGNIFSQSHKNPVRQQRKGCGAVPAAARRHGFPRCAPFSFSARTRRLTLNAHSGVVLGTAVRLTRHRMREVSAHGHFLRDQKRPKRL